MNNFKEKQSILIVDDVPMNIKILGTALNDQYNIKVATSGKEALLVAVSKNPPDLILLDIMMPEMDGYEVCKKLKQAPETREIPIIFVTAMNKEKDEEYGLNLGAVDYITKPFSIPIVKARVRNHLELKKYRDLLKENSMLDGLTGIANRRRFNDTMLTEWNRAKRSGSTLSMVMADIDFFKNYNDTYGHLEGDECLRKVASTLKGQLKRPADLAARWGGEEFACILPETGHDEALAIAENLRRSIIDLAIPHEGSLIEKIVTISIGVTSASPSENEEFESLIKKADDALYRAKEKGRNRVCFK
jgi:diguanylate cyclase (GGDEF)-like protein